MFLARISVLLAGGLIASAVIHTSMAAGVTLVTHGLWGDADSWVSEMAKAMMRYPHLPGTNFTCYQISVVQGATGLVSSARKLDGIAPTNSDSPESDE